MLTNKRGIDQFKQSLAIGNTASNPHYSKTDFDLMLEGELNHHGVISDDNLFVLMNNLKLNIFGVNNFFRVSI